MLELLRNRNIPISSIDMTLDSIISEGETFNVPIYQRLYVWKNEQIETLLEDLQRAYEEEPDERYFLGGIMVSESSTKSTYDLIDGQQRFTTLWLISRYFYDKKISGLQKFTYLKDGEIERPRMTFSTREFANVFFRNGSITSDITKEELKELRPIINAYKCIQGFFEENKNAEALANFILRKVIFVKTSMPKDTDENKVFEAMNNRGLQLEQHQILKSKLLRKLKEDPNLNYPYSLMWDACSKMEEYLEKNIKEVSGSPWKTFFGDDTGEGRVKRLPKDIRSCLIKGNNENEQDAKTLIDILAKEIDEEELELLKEKDDTKEDYDSGAVRSIISFPMLLLHTLRIFQKRVGNISDANESAAVKEKELIRIFSLNEHLLDSKENVVRFLDLLWEVRESFDRNIIKWSLVGKNDEVHLIKRLYRSENSFQRRAPKSNEGFALLQSMLYHSQQLVTHYWLTPLLNKTLDVEDKEELYSYLERLDNRMFCEDRNDEDLRESSYRMMLEPDVNISGDIEYVKSKLNEPMGTKFPRYWFYKTEYLLWRNRVAFDKEDLWKDFKITSKTSIEHISPQRSQDHDKNLVWSEKDTDEEKWKKLDDFGNLVLISPGMNSEYSNKPYRVKRSMFKEKLPQLDSLKSDIIFDQDTWSWDKCIAHKRSVIKLFEEYLRSKDKIDISLN